MFVMAKIQKDIRERKEGYQRGATMEIWDGGKGDSGKETGEKVKVKEKG